MPRFARGFDIQAARIHLRREDPALRRWIDRIGPLAPDPRWRRSFVLTDALARSILHQQLSGKAAATIVGRLESAVGSKVLDAGSLSRVDEPTLRACGVSGNKQRALRDLCRHAAEGGLPDARRLSLMDNEEIIAALTQVRGIGRWTVEMLLMFRLGRPDLLPVDDLGIRNGARRVDGGTLAPTPKALAARGECWGPYRTCASFYLWRIADWKGQ